MHEQHVFAKLQAGGIVAVLVIDRVEDAVPIAEALLAGGVRVMELTLRTAASLDALSAVCRRVPQMLAGAGTVLTTAQVRQVLDAGGEFGVAPGTNPRVIEEAARLGLPFAPGICTPSDIERALDYDCKLLKFFPAELSGGLALLDSIAAPYAHFGIKYVPLGGVAESNLTSYLRHPAVGPPSAAPGLRREP